MLDSLDVWRTLKRGVAVFSILIVASFPAIGQTPTSDTPHLSLMKKLAARDELNKGVKAYKSAHYDASIAHLQKATKLNPNLLIAKSYLGVALSANVVPNLDTKENMEIAQRAIDLFLEVLAKDPHDVNSMKQIAGIDYDIKRLDDAKAWQKKILAENPKDPEAAYTIGVIDWTRAHENALKSLTPVGIQDDGEGNINAPAEAMKAIEAQNGALVEEALGYLNQAVENRPDYDDAMVYMNLVYRRKADLDWGNETVRKDDVAMAKEWVAKAMDTRKTREEKRIAKPESTQP